MTGKRYDIEFKKMIIEQHESGSALKDLAEEYGVSRATLQNWKKLYGASLAPAGAKLAEISQINQALAKENSRLQEEVNFLKKCIGIFTEKK